MSSVWLGGVRTAVSAVALVGVTTMLATPAAAVPFSVSATSPGSDSVNLFFNQFDPSLGNLVAVIFSLSGSSTTTTLGISASGAEGGIFAVATGQADYDIVGPNGTLFNGNGQANASCNDFNVPFCESETDSATEPDFIPSTLNELSPGDDLTPYTGGGQFSVSVTATANEPNFTVCADLLDLASCSGTTGAAWVGDLSVEFQFDPVEDSEDVPAPATLALLGFGLLGLGLARRRRA
ncbi:MAG: choice-of-anchor E domain-containing protein [Alphaproteobacteria bacterium]